MQLSSLHYHVLFLLFTFSSTVQAGKWRDFKDWCSDNQKTATTLAVTAAAAIAAGATYLATKNKKQTIEVEKEKIIKVSLAKLDNYLFRSAFTGLVFDGIIKVGNSTKILKDCGNVTAATCEYISKLDGQPSKSITETLTLVEPHKYKLTKKNKDNLLAEYNIVVSNKSEDTPTYCPLPFVTLEDGYLTTFDDDSRIITKLTYANGTTQEILLTTVSNGSTIRITTTINHVDDKIETIRESIDVKSEKVINE